MRKVIFGVANSLDNYIARLDHAVDWLLWGKEAEEVMAAFWKTFDTIVMGRKTYEISLEHGSGSYADMKTYVCSRTMTGPAVEGVEFVSEDAVAFLRRLKDSEGKDICLMGGGELARPIFEAGLIDEIGFNIHPVLLGAGIPLFHTMNRQLDLELLECRPFQNGCVLVRYRVKS
jgi:dihydrofolate reductase